MNIRPIKSVTIGLFLALAGTSLTLPAQADVHGGGGGFRGAGCGGFHGGGGGFRGGAGPGRAWGGGDHWGGWHRGGWDGGGWGWGLGLGLGLGMGLDWYGLYGDPYYYPYAVGPAVGYYYPDPYYSGVVSPPSPPVSPQGTMMVPPQSGYNTSWFYCDSAKGYYPYVQQCPEPWRRVPALPPGPIQP